MATLFNPSHISYIYLLDQLILATASKITRCSFHILTYQTIPYNKKYNSGLYYFETHHSRNFLEAFIIIIIII